MQNLHCILQSVTRRIALIDMNLVTPKAGAKHELLFNKPVSWAGLLHKSSCLAAALGVHKLRTVVAKNLATFCCTAYI
jgi:hypothetical protein